MKETNPPAGEAGFIKQLEKKAEEQRRVVQTELMPEWAKGFGNWLAVNPWRVIVPTASIVYVVLRIAYGKQFRELILGLFGGF